MEKMRKPFQGVWNIIRFNWHFYVLAIVILLIVFVAAVNINPPYSFYFFVFGVLIFLSSLISLSVSYYVYDWSDLYNFNWIDKYTEDEHSLIININAGFDETSSILKNIFPRSKLKVFDFYNPEKHTEVSIKRARNAYPPFPNTQLVTTKDLPSGDNSADKIFVIFAAHEIRDEQERIYFFRELKRILKPSGQIIITEHLRDTANFLAYNIGFLHFYSKQNWRRIFQSASLYIQKEQKITPFITTFTLNKHGITP